MLSPAIATTCVQAACILHNFLLQDMERDPFVQDMEARLQKSLKEAWDLNVSGLHGIPRVRGFHSGMEPRAVRNIFTTYFMSKEGCVPWQEQYVHVDDLPNDK